MKVKEDLMKLVGDVILGLRDFSDELVEEDTAAINKIVKKDEIIAVIGFFSSFERMENCVGIDILVKWLDRMSDDTAKNALTYIVKEYGTCWAIPQDLIVLQFYIKVRYGKESFTVDEDIENQRLMDWIVDKYGVVQVENK